jgi:hypothetical protein
MLATQERGDLVEDNPRAALAELDRVGRAVRLRSRWYGWFLAALGAGTIAYYAAVAAAGDGLATIGLLALGWTTFMVTLTAWADRQPVLWRGLRHLRRPLLGVYFALVGATVLASVTLLHDQAGRGALGIIPALPCFAGAWMVLRR